MTSDRRVPVMPAATVEHALPWRAARPNHGHPSSGPTDEGIAVATYAGAVLVRVRGIWQRLSRLTTAAPQGESN